MFKTQSLFTTRLCLWLMLFIAAGTSAIAQEAKFTISGYVKDAANGEGLIGARIFSENTKKGAVTNAYGYYSLTLPQGAHTLEFSYLGYSSVKKEIRLNADQVINIELSETGKDLKEVVITSKGKGNENITQNKMSVIKLDAKEVRKIPILLGEADIVKAVQLLPGVQQAGDGSSNFLVRGGNIDHNLVMLDEAVVYNPSHVLGFFSTFNGDAVKDFELYKGGIPASYGGRLASVLDVRMKEGNTKHFGVEGGIGLLSSRLTVEGPIMKERSSFLISGRRSYFDIFFPFSDMTKDAIANFGDLNLKLNYTLGEKDRIFLSGYFGKDALGFGGFAGFGWGNSTGTLRWNHLFTKKLFVNTSLVYSHFYYGFDINLSDNLNFKRMNSIDDVSLKIDGNLFASPTSTLRFGTKISRYTFLPGSIEKITEASVITPQSLPLKRAVGADAYVSYSMKMGARITAEGGLRLSSFSNIGSGRSINYVGGSPTMLVNGFLKESPFAANKYTDYNSGEIYNTYIGLEPRANFTYQLNSESSVKASYNRMFQYMHLIQNITASTGQEFWTPSDNYIKPQRADQVAAGYFRNLFDNQIETSIEGYYKWMNNTVEVRDGADLQFNEAVEAQVTSGKGRAYGMELFVRKASGRTTGWVGYTLAKSQRQSPYINNGDWYSYRFDRTHYLTIVMNYQISDRVSVSGNFIYNTGEAFTLASQRYNLFGSGDPVVFYSSRNSARYPAYHRMDVSVTLRRKKKPGVTYRNNSDWVFSVYNVYGKKNVYSIDYGIENNVPTIYKYYLFTFVPSVTYNFKF